ncbi:DUF4124 domain-containing protein [Haliea sp. E17]|uniref:DUF4124 domain-containing protein n=1 Tax=Haliea sp. E17 TaxID=3401576 RepID=UPI003AAB426B
MNRKAGKWGLAAVLLLTLQGAAAGSIYRWLDASGNTVVSDRPPPAGTEYEVVSGTTGHVVPPPPEPETTPQATSGMQIVQEPPKLPNAGAPPPAQTTGFRPDKDPELCKQARANKLMLDTKPRIRITDENGELRFLTDEERAAEKTRTAEAIDAYCEN